MSKETKQIFYDEKSKILYHEYEDEDGMHLDKVWESVEFPLMRRDVDTNEMCLVVSAICRGRKVEKEIPLDEIQSQKLMRYAKYGFPFLKSDDRNLILAWFQKIIPDLEPVDVTNDIGWKEVDGNTYFQMKNAISCNSEVDVEYSGDLRVDKKGDFEEYKRILNNYVLPNIQTQVILAFSVSAALASYLNPDLTLVLHMNGESTTGKTTMLKLAASVWGSTDVDTNGIIQTWNTTKNALISDMCGFNGITLCYDELGASEADTSNLIYLLSNGTDKKRMNTEKSKKFSVNICSSGEIPLKTLEGVNGTDARLLEFSVQWTNDAQHADDLKKAISSCYGVLGEEFVKIILNIPKNVLHEKLTKMTGVIMSKFDGELEALSSKRKRIVKRAIEKIAVVVLAASILKNKLGLEFKLSKISEFMLTKSQLFNLPDDDCIIMLETYMQSRKVRCSHDENCHDISSKTDYSEIVTDEYICIPKQEFYNQMKLLCYGKNVVMNNLKELNNRKIIRCEAGKLYNRHKVGDKRFPFIDFDKEKMRKEGVDFE